MTSEAQQGCTIDKTSHSLWRRAEPRLAMMAAALLSPLLLAQGLATRRSVPRLPEPPGAREGTTGIGTPLRLLVLGDSAAAGVGARHQDQALLGQLVSRLREDFCVSWRRQAATGNTTAAVLDWLDAETPQQFDVAITSLGVNDVTGLVPRARWRRRQAELRALLKAKFGVRILLISGLPPLHGFPALPQPLRWVLGARATQLNQDLERDIAAEEDARFLNLRFTADATLMASDGFHPGPGVYAEWAARVASHIRRHESLSAGEAIC